MTITVSAAQSRRKVATVLVALGPERAAPLVRALPDSEIRDLAAEIATLGPVRKEAAVAALRELAEQLSGRRVAVEGNPTVARELLTRALGPARSHEIEEWSDPSVSQPFGYLAVGDPEVVARCLAGEPPAAVALALTNLAPDLAARILTNLPPDASGDVAMRLAGLEHVDPDVVAVVDADFRARLGAALRPRVRAVAGVASLVEMLSRSTKEQERAMLEALEARDPMLAAAVRDALFVFDDIARLDDRSVQQLLKGMDSRDLATALKNANAAVTERILGNLSERARDNLLEEIEFLKGTRQSDIDAARGRIVKQVQALEESGAITIERQGEESVE